MATISPDTVSTDNVPMVSWTGVSTADTMTEYKVRGPAGEFASVQLTGTWGSATVVLQGSNDATTWFTLKDVAGSSISATANAYFEFKTAAKFIKPSSSGGTGDNVDVKVTLRGRPY